MLSILFAESDGRERDYTTPTLSRHAPSATSVPINTKNLFLESGWKGADFTRQNEYLDHHLPNAEACVKWEAASPNIECVACVRTIHIGIVHIKS